MRSEGCVFIHLQRYSASSVVRWGGGVREGGEWSRTPSKFGFGWPNFAALLLSLPYSCPWKGMKAWRDSGAGTRITWVFDETFFFNPVSALYFVQQQQQQHQQSNRWLNIFYSLALREILMDVGDYSYSYKAVSALESGHVHWRLSYSFCFQVKTVLWGRWFFMPNSNWVHTHAVAKRDAS